MLGAALTIGDVFVECGSPILSGGLLIRSQTVGRIESRKQLPDINLAR